MQIRDINSLLALYAWQHAERTSLMTTNVEPFDDGTFEGYQFKIESDCVQATSGNWLHAEEAATGRCYAEFKAEDPNKERPIQDWMDKEVIPHVARRRVSNLSRLLTEASPTGSIKKLLKERKETLQQAIAKASRRAKRRAAYA